MCGMNNVLRKFYKMNDSSYVWGLKWTKTNRKLDSTGPLRNWTGTESKIRVQKQSQSVEAKFETNPSEIASLNLIRITNKNRRS